jgi:hypothetical protein
MDKYRIEKDFEHEGLRCVVVMQPMGHRCGYVGVPKEHPLYGLDYGTKTKALSSKAMSDIPIEKAGVGQMLKARLGEYSEEFISPEMFFSVHGGITYSGGGEQSNYPVESDLWWFGYDCAHFGDGKDLSVVSERERGFEMMYPTRGEVRTTEYCISECKSLAEQLVIFGKENP